MRRIWLVGTAIAAFVAMPAIDMQAHAASFDSTQATNSGTATDDGSDEDALYLACGCGGEGGSSSGGGGTEGGREGSYSGSGEELPE